MVQDDVLIDLARRLPDAVNDLRSLRRLHPKEIERSGQQLVDAVQRGLAIPREEQPKLPPVFEDGEIWRMLTMGVSHQAAFHLGMNMLWLFYCGWNLERALGRANLLFLFLGSVFAGSVLSMFGNPWIPSLGASGGIRPRLTRSSH